MAEPHYLRKLFVWQHLRADLQPCAEAYADMARHLDDTLPDNPEKTAAFRKLMESKDSAIRALVFKELTGGSP